MGPPCPVYYVERYFIVPTSTPRASSPRTLARPTSLFWLKSVARERNAVLATLSDGIGGVCPAVGRQQEEIKVHPRLISPLIEDDDSVMINDWTLDMHRFLQRGRGKTVEFRL
ncbi:hypothetical protein CEXT_478851 [Caerostris extrusa]|uniref:Uncharacterized protein n=1 Tax=Caerostris extrusa TaxID=172846 RepID=A0AAV4TX48_CAEEX|nr:hypothetical protein CEXT_478851 [Caerostris extrusa]